MTQINPNFDSCKNRQIAYNKTNGKEVKYEVECNNGTKPQDIVVTQDKIEEWDKAGDNNGKITYTEFKNGIQKDKDFSSIVSGNDISNLWVMYNDATIGIEAKTVDGVENIKVKSDGTYLVRTSSDAKSAGRPATLHTSSKNSAAGNINTLTNEHHQLSAIQSKENGIDISGMIYENGKLASITIGDVTYSGNDIRIYNSDTKDVSLIADGKTYIFKNDNGKLDNIEITEGQDTKTLKLDENGNPISITESDGTTTIKKSATSNTSKVSIIGDNKVGRTVKDLAQRTDLDFERVDLRDVLGYLSEGKIDSMSNVFEDIIAELSNQLGTMSTTVDNFLDNFFNAHPEYNKDPMKTDIKTTLKNLAGKNGKIELKDIGNSVLAYSLLSNDGRAINDSKNQHSAENMKDLMKTIENNPGDYAAIAEHACRLNKNITMEQAFQVLAKAEVSDNGAGNGTLNTKELNKVGSIALNFTQNATLNKSKMDVDVTLAIENAQKNFGKMLDVLDGDSEKNLTPEIKQAFINELNEIFADNQVIPDTDAWLKDFATTYDIKSNDDDYKLLKGILDKLKVTGKGDGKTTLSVNDIGRFTTAYALLQGSSNIKAENLLNVANAVDTDNIVTVAQANGSEFDDNTIKAIVKTAEEASGTEASKTNSKLGGNEAESFGIKTMSKAAKGTARMMVVEHLTSYDRATRNAELKEMLNSYQQAYCTGKAKTAKLPEDLLTNLTTSLKNVDYDHPLNINTFINLYYPDANQNVKDAINTVLDEIGSNGTIRSQESFTDAVMGYAHCKANGIELNSRNLSTSQIMADFKGKYITEDPNFNSDAFKNLETAMFGKNKTYDSQVDKFTTKLLA